MQLAKHYARNIGFIFGRPKRRSFSYPNFIRFPIAAVLTFMNALQLPKLSPIPK